MKTEHAFKNKWNIGSVEILYLIINHRCTQINADANNHHLRASEFICGYGSEFIDNQDFYKAGTFIRREPIDP